MQKTIISDTSCLILLDKLNLLIILQQLFGEALVTSVIASEFGEKLPEWIKIRDPQNQSYQALLQVMIDKGEASAITLAMEQTNCLLILDDLKARKVASELGMNITGTIGILIEAKLNGLIPSIKNVLTKIKETNFRITADLELLILKACDE
jgi:predicted nucleic acid-binding protein